MFDASLGDILACICWYLDAKSLGRLEGCNPVLMRLLRETSAVDLNHQLYYGNPWCRVAIEEKKMSPFVLDVMKKERPTMGWRELVVEDPEIGGELGTRILSHAAECMREAALNVSDPQTACNEVLKRSDLLFLYGLCQKLCTQKERSAEAELYDMAISEAEVFCSALKTSCEFQLANAKEDQTLAIANASIRAAALFNEGLWLVFRYLDSYYATRHNKQALRASIEDTFNATVLSTVLAPVISADTAQATLEEFKQSAAAHTSDSISVVSSTGRCFQLSIPALSLSPVLYDSRAVGGSENTSIQVPPVMNLNDDVLDLAFRFMEYHAAHGAPTETEGSAEAVSRQHEVDAWTADFLAIDDDTLFSLILAANTLNVKSLLDASCKAVADQIKQCKTPQEIRRRFNIKNDFTPEEEEQVRQENAWAEER